MGPHALKQDDRMPPRWRYSAGMTRESKKPAATYQWLLTGFRLYDLGWLMGLEPTTTGITILDSTN